MTIPTLIYVNKREYQDRDTQPSKKRKTVIPDHMLVGIWGSNSRINIKKGIHDMWENEQGIQAQVWISKPG